MVAWISLAKIMSTDLPIYVKENFARPHPQMKIYA